jgi:TolB-like protein/tRNA A-37 threonylcarbamoyl transferase component Bud32/Tfp pilus assembly protein PilF
MIGKIISHYRILEKLGEGGMGVVYKARDIKLDRIVALKFLPRHLLCDSEAKTRFEHEAKSASALNHTNITTIYEIDEIEGECFIAMEYIEGKSLKKLIEEKTFTLKEVLDVAIQVSEGLAIAHEKGIVHRDIKSDNIMLTPRGRVKIMDFGLAKLKGITDLTKTGTTMGTVAYMSPEQARGEAIDHRTDLWSLGVVIYEMITKQLPFKSEYEQAVIYAILNEEPKPMTETRPEIPSELEQIVRKALAQNPDSRYQNAGDVLVDLEKLKPSILKREFSSAKPQPSIAVLPFTNLSADKEQEYFCDGMAEEIINALTQVEGLHVVARTSAFFFRGKEIDIREIGRKLNVGAVLEGSVRKAGNRLRITAQLVNVADGYHLWSERYDREMEDVFAIQEEISLSIVDKLKGKLLKEEKVKLVKRYTDNPEAYNLYLKGRYFWNRRYEGGLQKAVECFQEAIDKDPLYALAYAGIADCYNQFGLWSFLHSKEAYPRAKVACAKALEIDDTLAEAYASLGWIKTFYDWDWAEAEKAFKRALELNPNYAAAHYFYGLYLGIMGNGVEAIAEAKKSVELDPLCLILNAVLGLSLYWWRQYDEAIEQLHKTLEMDPNFAIAHFYLGLSYAGKQRWKESIISFQEFVNLWPGSPIPVGYLGFAYGMSGQEDETLKMLDQLSKLSQQRYVSSLYKALVYAGLGKKNQAFEYLDKAYDERESWMVTLKTAPFMDILRSDPRYEALIKKMGMEK